MIDVKIDELRKLQGGLRAKLWFAEGATISGVREAMKLLRNEARALAPRDTGALRKSLKYGAGAGKGFKGATGAVWSNVTVADHKILKGKPLDPTGEDVHRGYALYVHEINKSYRNGTWKFVEFAYKLHKWEIHQTIKRHLRPGRIGI